MSRSYSSFPTDNTAAVTKPAGICPGLTAVLHCEFLLACFPGRGARTQGVVTSSYMGFFLLAFTGPGETVTRANASYQLPAGLAVRKRSPAGALTPPFTSKQKAELCSSFLHHAAPTPARPVRRPRACHSRVTAGYPRPRVLPSPQPRLCGRLMTSHSFP